MIRSRFFAALTAVVLALGFSFAGSSAALAGQGENNGADKVFVCKYVGTPGTDEVLQTGQNPISVSVNAIPNYQGVGSYFADAQGRSYVLAEDTRTGGGQTGEPDVSECPPAQGPVASASITPAAADCDNDTQLIATNGSISNATWGTPVIDGSQISITATRTGSALFAAGDGVSGDRTTKTFTFPFEQAPVGDCGPGVATAGITINVPDCFDNRSTLIASDDANSSNIASWSTVTTDVNGDDTYLLITATAADGFVFAAGEGVSDDGTQKTFRVLQETVTDEDCVLPAIGVVVVGEKITCLDPEGWFSFGPGDGVSEADAALIEWTVGPAEYGDNDEPGIQHAVSETVTITVTASLVDSALGEYAVSDESGDGEVDPETGAITWTFMFFEASDCDETVVVPEVEYVDECDTMSYTIFAAVGVTYTRTVNGFEYAVVFPDGEDSVTFPAALLDEVQVEATALPGYVLSDDYEIWDYQFVEGFCPETGPATTASAEFTLGECEGDSTVELTDEGGVIWRIDGEVVDGNATHSLPVGTEVEVTAELEGPTDEQPLGWTWSDPEQVTSWVDSIPAVDEECSPELLASTGLGTLAEQVGVLAVLLTLAGMGLVIRRRLSPVA